MLLLCAGVVLLFTFADVAAIGKFSPAAFSVRLFWAALMVGAAYWLDRAPSAAVERTLLYSVGIATSGFFALLVGLTGGANSPLFHWILAMPVLVAVIVQEAPAVTVASAAVMVASGVAILARGKSSRTEDPFPVSALLQERAHLRRVLFATVADRDALAPGDHHHDVVSE
ncbi:MAG: hypothetical protein ACJ790_21840 [Myxococcaceae bacterium]